MCELNNKSVVNMVMKGIITGSVQSTPADDNIRKRVWQYIEKERLSVQWV